MSVYGSVGVFVCVCVCMAALVGVIYEGTCTVAVVGGVGLVVGSGEEAVVSAAVGSQALLTWPPRSSQGKNCTRSTGRLLPPPPLLLAACLRQPGGLLLLLLLQQQQHHPPV